MELSTFISFPSRIMKRLLYKKFSYVKVNSEASQKCSVLTCYQIHHVEIEKYSLMEFIEL